MRKRYAFTTRTACWCINLILLGVTTACSGGAIKAGDSGQQRHQTAATPAAAAPFQPGMAVKRLLERADLAYSSGRYTSPAENNALDMYEAALLLDPGNPEAQAGLDAVLIAHIDQARSALSAGRIKVAEDMVQRGRAVFKRSPLLQQLESELQQAQVAAARKREAVAEVQADEGERFRLNTSELDKRSAGVAQTLGELAMRVRDSHESVMIYARSDREGRWIYQVMQEAVGEFRIRGDIRISAVPSVVLMEPL